MRKIPHPRLARRGDMNLLGLLGGIVAGAILLLAISWVGGNWLSSYANAQRSNAKDHFDSLVREVEALIGSQKDFATSQMWLSLPNKAVVIGFSFLNSYIQRGPTDIPIKLKSPTSCNRGSGGCLCIYFSGVPTEEKYKDKNVACKYFGSHVFFITRREKEPSGLSGLGCFGNDLMLPSKVLGSREYPALIIGGNGLCPDNEFFPAPDFSKPMYLERTVVKNAFGIPETFIYIASYDTDEVEQRKALAGP